MLSVRVMMECRSERCNVKKTWLFTAGFEDIGRVPWAKESQKPPEAGKGKGVVSPLEIPEKSETLPALWF